MVNSIPLNNLLNDTINWIPGRNLQIIWVKILTTLFGIENSDIWKFNVFGLMLLGILGVVFYRFLVIIGINQSASIICSILFILWPTHSETSFWIEQTIQVQLPLIFLILWLILNFSNKKYSNLFFITADLFLIALTLFTYDQAASLIAFLIVVRIIYFVHAKGYKLIYTRFIPSILLLLFWVKLIVGARKGGPEIRLPGYEGFLNLWHNSFEINSRIFSPRFQPYGFYGFWPWSLTVKLLFILIIVILFFIFLRFKPIYFTRPTYLFSNNFNRIFYIFIFYFAIIFGYFTFAISAAKFPQFNYVFWDDRMMTSRLYFVTLGIFLFILINLALDFLLSRNNRLYSSRFNDFLFVRLFLLICFYISYLPAYFWSISPRHHLIPSFIVCLIVAVYLNHIIFLIDVNKFLYYSLAIFVSLYLATLALNFHFSSRAYSQSWILKQRLYADLYSSISLSEYTPESSCWIVENPPQEFMGYPLFVYESPQLGLNYMYKLPGVNTCDPSQDLTRFNVLKLAFNPDVTYFENFEYKFEVIPSQL